MPATPLGNPSTVLFPLIAIGVVMLRGMRARRLRVETLWIAPVLILVLVGLALSQEGTLTPVGIAFDLAGLAVGALLGWWRARFTKIAVNSETHELTRQASPVGMLVILGLFVVRYTLRTYAAESASALHLSAAVVTDALLVMTVGLVCAQRLEIALRAMRLLNEARTSKA